MDAEDGGPLDQIGQRDRDLPVEAARAEECRVENLRRFVAASTTIPSAMSKPSISDKSWLSVCSRSSLETAAPEPERRWPMASTSSMKMIAGARFHASAKRSRTRAAPTPTNISTKLEPVTEKKGTSASPATAGEEGLAGAGRPHHEHAAGRHRASTPVPIRVPEEVDHLGDLLLGPLVAGHVGKAGLRAILVEDLCFRPPDAENALQLPRRSPREAAPEVEDDDEGQQQDHPRKNLGAERGAGGVAVICTLSSCNSVNRACPARLGIAVV